MIGLQRVVDQLKIDEGFKAHPYRCSEGKLTVGYGHNLDDRGINSEAAEYILIKDIEEAHRDLDAKFTWFRELPDSKQEILINMCFNLGINRLAGFKRMVEALSKLDYETAAIEMINSKWYTQVGERARRLTRSMSDGKYT